MASEKMLLREVGENELVRRIAAWTRPTERSKSVPSWAKWKLLAGIGDDAAVVQARAATPQALTTDMLVEGTHFFSEHPPEQLGRKAAEVNLSDLASMGAWPAWVLVSLGLPGKLQLDWVFSFYRGLKKALAPYSAVCLGGDCVRSEHIVINIATGGYCEGKAPLALRSQAKPGQFLYVTETLGDSGAGLHLLRDSQLAGGTKEREALIRKHQSPRARVFEGIAIAHHCEGAMMDLSDGLGTDLPRMAAASACGFEVSLSALPISSTLKHLIPALPLKPEEFALWGGEDYELLFTSSQDESCWLDKVARATGKRKTRITRIGRVVPGDGVRYLDANNRAVCMRNVSFQHY
jgi:thiamine-monophosphate kinase